MNKMNSDISLIDNNDFVYLTGSLVFEKETLDISNIESKESIIDGCYFKSIYNSNGEFRDIIDYLSEVFIKKYDIASKIEYSKTIDSRINPYFYTWLYDTNQYIYFCKEYHIIMSLGFNNNNGSYIKKLGTTIYENTVNWIPTINKFLEEIEIENGRKTKKVTN